MENRKNFLNEVARKLDIKNPSDWGNVKLHQIHKFGGVSLLSHYYNNSVFACLQSVYNGDFNLLIHALEIEWKKEWFSKVPNSYWKSMENRKMLMDQIAKKLNIKNPSDWGKVTQNCIYELGGCSLLTRYYNGSLFACLQSIYQGKSFSRKSH